ncbi:hypothetical protein LEP1GSC202_3346 [Leptospira yanagawae serovar Saopaulo str. Sao Paulo = ATCC 700523]|uniref:Uncharacterized protein n=1 Tax=Leptospira yanagawae serovar Saopaulo str. Sao Paulo = ATCC 700523 TaxID=1249483 RepID=A0A5E8HA86_9LEPT|nr:hypothetical protein [Leptospira yanagawae]EOQ88119.1 hypothetical protein LEP1GSC202_3346 [Leptospira yanagawae serovar Saopaulo str. Sao Paulo = ATCC 700523]
MSLLLKSNIESLTKERLTGNVARIGGLVDQLIDYSDLNVTDINVLDGGFGEVLTLKNARTIKDFLRVLRLYITQEKIYLKKGARYPRNRKTILLDMHFATKSKWLHSKFDHSISSNVLEHSPNIINLLLNFHFITKKDGYQFHAIPHYKYTYDCFRIPHTLEHFIEDFENDTGFDDDTHTQDYIQSAIEKHGWQKTFHEKYPVTYPFLHFHVFDELNVRKLFEYMFEEVVVDVIKTDQFSDILVFCKNQLNQNFLQNYHGKISKI